MPAKSEDQQQAAGIALQAKKEGTVDELPDNSASKQMAQSMTEDELEKLASTKHKGLPKDKNNESVDYSKLSLEEVFAEEMLGTSAEDDPEEQITTQKSKPERIEDREIGNGKENQDSWTAAAGGRNPAVAQNARTPLSTNTGSSRVSEHQDLNSLDIIFEQEDEDPKKFLPPDETVDAAIMGGDEDDLDEGFGSSSVMSSGKYDDWDEPWGHGAAGASEELDPKEEMKLIQYILDNAKQYNIPPEEQYDDGFVEIDDLFYDVFGFYPEEEKDIEMARRAVERAQEIYNSNLNETITPGRWQKLAGILKE